MENFSHSRQLNTGFSKKSCNGGSSGSFAAPAKAIYDDVFGGPPRLGATTLSPRAEDYAEIFGSFRSSRATSIPVLDLPLLGEAEVYFDVRSSGFDYGEVFGGFDGADFAMSYEDLVRVDQSNGRYDSSDEAWTPEDAEYSSEELDHSAKEQCFSNLDIYESIDGGTEFNISYHKAGQRNSGDMSHLGKLPAVPGHTLVVDKISTLPKTDNDHTLLQASEGHRDIDFSGELKGVSKLRKTVSHPANGASKLFLGNEVGHDKRYARNGSLPTGMFVTISDVSLKTQPSELPPPSRPPPPALDVQRGDSMKQIPGYKSVSTDWIVGDGSPPYFDVEVDASSSAAASAAAMKEAMEQAQAKLKSAKELMERKREGFSSHVKSSSKNARKGKEEKVTQIVDGHDSRRGDGYMGTYVGEEHGASGEWQKAKESQQLKKSIGQKKCPTMDRRPMEDAHGREALSSPGSDRIDEDEASEWKEATQFFELVRTSKSRKASDQENNRRLFMQNESIQEHENNENKEAMGALRQQRQNGRTVKAAGDADQLKEDEKKLQVPKGGCEQNDGSTKPEAVKVPHRQKGFECMVQVAQGISREKEKIFQMDPQLIKTEKKDAGSDWPQKHENMIEFQRQGGKIEVKQTTKQREKERLPRTDEREGSQREKEAFEREKVEKKLKAVAEENEIQQKEALEEEEIKKIKEACEQEENTKKQKETREREKEKKLREALKREENERRIKEALEEEENERKLREIWEKEEEKKQKEAVEGEENEKRHRNTRECKENEKRLKDALEEVVDNERRLKESVKLDENAKRQREAREREENERRLREATEREENEKKLKEFQERGEIEKILEEAFGNEEIQTEIKKACVTEETGKKTEGACGEANATLKEGEEVEDIEVGKEAACLLGGMVDSSQEPCSLKEAKGKHLDDCDGEELKEFKKMGEDKGLLNQACKLDDGNNYGEVQLASTRVGKSEKQNDPEDTVFEETGKLPIKPKDRDDKAAVESENLLVDGRNEVSGLAQGSSENHKKDLPVQEVTESPCSDETANEEGKAVQNNEQESIHKVESVCHADCDIQGQRRFAPDRRGTESFTKQAQATLSEEDIMDNLKTSRGMKDSVETRRKEETPVPTTSAVTGNRHNIGQPVHVILSTETTVKDKTLSSDEKGDQRIKREQELEKERLRKIEEEIEREREREKDRMAIDRVTLEVRERAYTEARERAERAAVERAMNEARERLEKACAEAREKSIDYKTSAEARLRAERGAVERAAAEARVRAFEKAMADRAAFGARERIERSISDKFSTSTWNSGVRPSSSSDAQDLQSQWTSSSSSGSRYPYSSGYSGPYHGERREGVEVESAQRCKARLERHQRTAERAAKALAEKNMRDLLVQREQAERNRLAETLDADVKRWSSGKEGNLRALLSTLQYILVPDSGWQPIPLTEVITSAAVKKAYRKATLCVHPDKLQQRGASIQQKYICEKVFDLLKEAWNKFNSEER